MTAQDSPTRRRVVCDCGAHLWDEVVEADGSAYLLIGGRLLCTHFTGACMECKRELFWTPPVVRLRRILRSFGRDGGSV